ncbi:MAG: molybdate ABC transporter substrate-binding protein [Deltaproteobacteria bacterium]|nr:molybdate ABC transporter substrate-binding protein [Deltaproteobacteria bacterium]
MGLRGVGYLILLCLIHRGAALGAVSDGHDTLTVAVAANAQYVVQEIAEDWERDVGGHATLVVGSSGKLAAQVREGAPFDVFVAADTEYPAALQREGFAERPHVYAIGSLVVWTWRDSLRPDVALTFLRSGAVKQIAIANPAVAPYGAAAMEALTHAGLWPAVQSKLVLGESVAQVNHYLTTGVVDAVITAQAMVHLPAWRGRGRWMVVDPSWYRPIEQAAVLLRHGRQRNAVAAEAFLAFLGSPTAQQRLTHYGYRLPL